jgi:hypothetical protein
MSKLKQMMGKLRVKNNWKGMIQFLIHYSKMLRVLKILQWQRHWNLKEKLRKVELKIK